MSDIAYRRIEVTGPGTLRVVDQSRPQDPLAPDQVEGATLVSLVSPGTELQNLAEGAGAPRGTGYAAVFRVERCGDEVDRVSVGDLAFAMGPHQGFQRHPAAQIVRIPDGVDPEVAVFCRLAAVSWSALALTNVRPDSRVLVTGLGIIGNLAAQLAQAAGYPVIAVDPVERRRDLATECGIRDVRPGVPLIDAPDRSPYATGPEAFALAVECSGHESAVLDAARALVAGGELVTVGVPWLRRTDIPAHELLDVVFHRMLRLRSGWEAQLPFSPGHGGVRDVRSSQLDGHATALRWLAEGRIRVAGLADTRDPEDAVEVYAGLPASHRLTALFDWRGEG